MNNQRPSTLAVGDRKNRVVVRGTAAGRRRKNVTQKVTLDRVLGITVKDSCTLTSDPRTGYVAYVAGCVIVIFNPRKNKQFHIVNQSRKTLTALSFSGDGRYLVSGECGHNPAVRIWDVQEKTQVAEFHGHKYGISCVAFSPDIQHVVSVGEQHDMVVNVWDWKKNVRHSSGKVAAKVTGLAFSEDGSYFVIVGNRCVKFYYLVAKSRTRQIQALPGRSGILGEQRNNFFCSVVCGKGENKDKVYAITKSGFLCEISSKRLLDKWVELRTTGAHSITADEEFIFVACDGGLIRLFSASTLHFITTLPKPHYLGINVSAGIDASHMLAHRDNAQYPDAIALTYDIENKKLTCVYSDHSLYMWDVREARTKIGKQWSFLYHAACVFGVELYPELGDGNRAALPPGSFFTCSSDGTIRVWNVDPAMNTSIYKRNVYSDELLKMLYVCEDSLDDLQDKDYNPAGTTDKTDPEKGKSGIRCMRVSPDGQSLASGDRSGNVRVHDLQFWDQVHEIEAHDSEVLCLEYTQPTTGLNLLASASRDRLIHVFDMAKNCSLVQTLDDHSSSITSVKFNRHGEQLQMISCGADKALMFRVAVYNPDLQFVRNHHVVNKTTLYDLAVDPTQKFITTACQDRNLRIYNIASGKLKRTYKGAPSDEGTLIRVELDPSGIYAATSCSDKSVSIYDFYSGECVATMTGHSELVTGLKFTNDCKQLISVSGDGCIFIWKLPWELTHNMKERLKEMGEKVVQPPPEYNMLRRGTYVVPPEAAPSQQPGHVTNAWQAQQQRAPDFQPAMQSQPDTEDETDDGQPDEDSTPEECNFATGLLPSWAQKQVNQGEDLPDVPSPSKYSSPTHPRGRWAQNIPGGGLKVKSQLEELNQSIELRLEDCFGSERRRYTVEPDVLLEQVRPFATRTQGPFAGMDAEEISKICGEEFMPASQKFGLLSEEGMQEATEGFVTTSRGSDPPFCAPASLRASTLPTTPKTNGTAHSEGGENGVDGIVEDIEGDEEEEEEEEEKEEEGQDKEIIFYPPEEDDSNSPESLKFQVTASTQSHEELAKRHSRHKSKEGSRDNLNLTITVSQDAKSQPSEPSSTDGNEEDDDGDESDDDDEEDEEEDAGPVTPTASPRRSILPTVPPSPASTPDEEKFLHTNFSFAEKERHVEGGFAEQEKFGKCLEQLQSRFSDEISSGRLSISSRFLSRSQLTHPRVPPIASQSLAANLSSGMNAEEYLRRRKEEVAKAVEETRKRLTSLGWKVGEKKLTGSLPVSPKASTSTMGEGQVKVKPAIPPRMSKPANKKSTAPVDGKPGFTEVSSTPAPTETVLSTSDKDTCAEGSGANKDFTPAQKDRGGPPRLEDAEKQMDSNKFASKESSQEGSPDISLKSEDSPVSNTAREKTPESNKQDDKPFILDDQVIRSKDSDPNLRTPKAFTKQSPETNNNAGNLEEEAENDANKENVSSVSMLNQKKIGEVRSSEDVRSRSGGERSNVAGQKSNMRRVASLTDLRKENMDKNESSPTLAAPAHSAHGRSSSVERERKASPSDNTARQKRREKADRLLPLLPTPKTRSYEGRTESSMAKVVRRISDSPPSSPNTLRRKKTSTTTGPKGGPMKATDPTLMTDAKSDLDVNIDLNSEASVESSRNSEDGSVKSMTAVDSLAMPPPSSTHVSKAKTAARKVSASKMADRGRRRSSSTSSGTGSRGRRASTSSLPSEREGRSKTPSGGTRSKIPAAMTGRTKKGGSPAAGESKPQLSPRLQAKAASKEQTSSKVVGDAAKTEASTADSVETATGLSRVSPLSGQLLKDGDSPRTDSDGSESKHEEEEADKSSASEDTMVLDPPVTGSGADQASGAGRRGASGSGAGEGERDRQQEEASISTTDGGTTPDDTRAMRADLRIDLDDITVDKEDQDPGDGLRQSVDVMQKAFQQCIHYVTMIEKRGNHREDLSYFNSTFSSMNKSFTTQVRPVVQQRNATDDYSGMISDVSDACLNSVSDGGLLMETSRSLPSLSDYSTEGRVKRSDRRAESVDATGTPSASSPQALAMLQHYSDMLVAMVRVKMEDSEDGLLSGRSRVSSLDLDADD